MELLVLNESLRGLRRPNRTEASSPHDFENFGDTFASVSLGCRRRVALAFRSSYEFAQTKLCVSEFIFHCSENSRTRKSRIGSSEGARNARIYTTWFYIPRRHERGKNVISRVAPKGCADRFCLLESSKDTRNVDTMKPILRDSNSFRTRDSTRRSQTRACVRDSTRRRLCDRVRSRYSIEIEGQSVHCATEADASQCVMTINQILVQYNRKRIFTKDFSPRSKNSRENNCGLLIENYQLCSICMYGEGGGGADGRHDCSS